MPQPVLRTDRLLLVPLREDHIEHEVLLDSDPEVLRFISGRAHSRDEVVDSHRRRMALASKVDGLGYWMAFVGVRPAGADAPPRSEEEGDFVGLMMLPPAHGPDQPDDPSVCDLGYRLLHRQWGNGFASEASRELLRHAFATIEQGRVLAQTMAVNAGSRRVMEAIGMRYVRTFHTPWEEPLPDAELGEVEYEMTCAMWESRESRMRSGS